MFIVDEEQKHVQFAKTFLVGWDNTLSNEQARDTKTWSWITVDEGGLTAASVTF